MKSTNSSESSSSTAALPFACDCGHQSSRAVVLVRPVLERPAIERICHGCYAPIAKDYPLECFRLNPVRSDLNCFECDRSTGVRFHLDTGLGICDFCFERISARERQHSALQVVPMDIVPDEVVPGLYIGAKESAANRKTLRDRNITRILVCGDALPQYHENDDSLVYLRFAIADSLAQNITEYIPYAMEFIKESLDSGQSVLVHCNAGVSRSGSMIVAWLMKSQQLAYEDAIKLAKEKRSIITPNTNFVKQLRSFDFSETSKEDKSEITTPPHSTSSASTNESLPTGKAALPKAPIYLIGDSTIDNVVWVHDDSNPDLATDRSVAGHLRRILGSSSAKTPVDSTTLAATSRAVINLAADGFTSKDVLHGGQPVISRMARVRMGDPFPTHESNFKPLETLATLASENSHSPIVVLSIGGNDVRETLNNPYKIPEAIPKLTQNMFDIIQAIRGVTDKIIIMMQYRPCLLTDLDCYGVYNAIDMLPMSGPSITPLQKVNALLQQLYSPILTLAADLGLPLIDLPNTFNVRDKSLYVHQIEPSAKGGALSASLIAHVVKSHDFTQKRSAIFSIHPNRHDEFFRLFGASEQYEDSTSISASPFSLIEAQVNPTSESKTWAVNLS